MANDGIELEGNDSILLGIFKLFIVIGNSRRNQQITGIEQTSIPNNDGITLSRNTRLRLQFASIVLLFGIVFGLIFYVISFGTGNLNLNLSNSWQVNPF